VYRDVSEASPAQLAPRTAAPRKRVPLAYWLHSLFGLKLSLFLGFVCLTGTIATISHEIEWLYKPEVRASPVIGDVEWGAMWEAAQQEHPDARLTGIGTFDRSESSYFAKAISAVDAEARDFTIYVDPGTARVTGHEYGRSFQDFMRGLHYYLFAPGTIPMYVITSLGFVLIASLITGLIAYKKFWRGFMRMPRWHRDARTWIGDLHRLAGLWSLWFVALIGLTSIWYFVEHAGLDLQTPEPVVDQPIAVLNVGGKDIDRWVGQARRAMPGLTITAVYLPYEPGNPVIVQGQWRAWLVRERTNAVFIDPATNHIIGRRVAHTMGIGERIVHTADPLHFGTFGGLVTKLIWAAFGLLLTGMAASGAFIYARRTRIAVQSGIALGAFNYLGAWKWPSLVTLILVPSISIWFW
jgi:uncharacterized iron-regulated membrane protein